MAKPQQDMRFDVPTIGITTIENLHKAGARVLAIEAGKTILLDEPEVVAPCGSVWTVDHGDPQRHARFGWSGAADCRRVVFVLTPRRGRACALAKGAGHLATRSGSPLARGASRDAGAGLSGASAP